MIDTNDDDRFSRLLEAVEQDMAAGITSEAQTKVDSPRLHARLAEAQECLRILRATWPQNWKKSSDNRVESRTRTAQPMIGRFEIRRELGRGGHGVVYLAFDPLLKRDIALKVPRPEYLVSEVTRQRFQREAQLAARLDHPNLVTIHEVGTTGPITYLVTSYCPGPSLATWLRSQPDLATPTQIVQLLLPLAEAVAFMHAQGVLHRDIKPGNILLDRSGQRDSGGPGIPKLTDFGLAVFADTDARESRSGTVIGTLAYMPPEQVNLQDSSKGAQQDIYSLGVVLYECLTGKPPFKGATEADTIRQLLTDDPTPPRRLRQAIPRDLEIICLKCLEKDPEHRYASAELLANDLQAFLNGEPIRAKPASHFEALVKWASRYPAVATLSIISLATTICLLLLGIQYTSKLRQHGLELKTRSMELSFALSSAEASERQLVAENYAFQVNFAESLQTNEALTNMDELLEKLRPSGDEIDNRGFEWYHLKTISSHQRIVRGHRRPVYAITVSPNGEYCATGSRDGMIIVWDLQRKVELARWFSADTPIHSIIFSTNSKLIAVLAKGENHEPSLTIWDAVSRQRFAEFTSNDSVLESIVDSVFVDEITLLCRQTATDESVITRWNWQRDTMSPITLPAPNEIRYGKGSFDREAILSHSESPRVSAILNFQGQKSVELRDIGTEAIVRAWWANDSRSAVVELTNYEIHLINRGSGNTIRKWGPFEEQIRSLAFANNGRHVAVALSSQVDPSLPDQVIVLDSTNPEPLDVRFRVDCAIHSLAWTADSQTIGMACEDHHIRMWMPFAPPPITSLIPSGIKEAWSLAFSPDSKRLAVGYDDEKGMNHQTLRVWDLLRDQDAKWLDGHQSMVSGVAFSHDGKLLYSAGHDRCVKVWDAATGEFKSNLGTQDSEINSLAISSDGNLVATGGLDKSAKIWNVRHPETPLTLTGHGDRVLAITFSPTNRVLATSDNTFEIRFWNSDTGRPLNMIADLIPVVALAYSPDGRLLATANQDGIISIYDTLIGVKLKSFPGHPGEATAITFTADGKTLATAAIDRSIRLWHVKTGRQLLTFANLPGKATRLAFSPNGRLLAASLLSGEVRLWRTIPFDD